MDPPPCVQNAMLTKDKKPFTYTPGGIDLSEVRSPRMQRRLERNANLEGASDLPSNPPQLPPQNIGPLPPSALAAMRPQTQVQVFPSPPPPPPMQKNIPPPPPPPICPLPTQKVTTGDNQVLERPDMTKIIPDNPMALLRKTGGPAPRKNLEQMYEEQDRHPPSPPQRNFEAHSPRYQPPVIERQAPVSPPIQQQRQPQVYQPPPQQYQPPSPPQNQYQPQYQPPQPVQRSTDSPKVPSYQPPIIERQPTIPRQEQPQRNVSSSVGSLYIPPLNQQQQKVVSPPTPPERNQPQVESPGGSNLREAPRPWQQKNVQQQQEVPAWARKEDVESQSPPAAPNMQQRWQPQASPAQAPSQQPPSQQFAPRSPQAQISPRTPSTQSSSNPFPVHIEIRTVPYQQEPEPSQRNPNAVYVTQPVVLQHPGPRIEPPYKGEPKPQSQQQQQPQPYQQPRQQVQQQPKVDSSGARIIPIQIEGRTPPSTPGGERNLSRQLSWGTQPPQSNSFKVIQKITKTDDEEDDTPVTQHSPRYPQEMPEQMRRMKVDNGHFRQGNGQPQPYVHPSEQVVPEPKKYMGSNIPSRSFKILQAMTAPSESSANANYNEEIPYNPHIYNPYGYPYYPPPYWPDYYTNFYPQEQSEQPKSVDKSSVKNGRSTPVPPSYSQPYWHDYYPNNYPQQQSDSTSKMSDRSSKSSKSGGRSTPLPNAVPMPPPMPPPYWGYMPPPTPYGRPRSTTPKPENNLRPQTPKPNEYQKIEEPYHYPIYQPYFDPYYYSYYYGYPPVMTPYPFYHSSTENEEYSGYSSMDEMSNYNNTSRRSSLKRRNSLENGSNTVQALKQHFEVRSKSAAPRITITPTYSQENINIIPPDKVKQEPDEDSDTEIEEDRYNQGLRSIKSVQNINVYVDNEETTESEDTSEEETDEEEISAAQNGEESIPHQLSVIYEESERGESRRSFRCNSITSESTTIAEHHSEEEEEDFLATQNVKYKINLFQESSLGVSTKSAGAKTTTLIEQDTLSLARFSFSGNTKIDDIEYRNKNNQGIEKVGLEEKENSIKKPVVVEAQFNKDIVYTDKPKQNDFGIEKAPEEKDKQTCKDIVEETAKERDEDWWNELQKSTDESTIKEPKTNRDDVTPKANSVMVNVGDEVICVKLRKKNDNNRNRVQEEEYNKENEDPFFARVSQRNSVYDALKNNDEEDEEVMSGGTLMRVDSFASQLEAIKRNSGLWSDDISFNKPSSVIKEESFDSEKTDEDNNCPAKPEANCSESSEEIDFWSQLKNDEDDFTPRRKSYYLNEVENQDCLDPEEFNGSTEKHDDSTNSSDSSSSESREEEDRKLKSDAEEKPDESEETSESDSSEDDQGVLKEEQQINRNSNSRSKSLEPQTIKDRIEALKNSIALKQSKLSEKEEINVSVKGKTASTKSSIKSFEEYSEEEEPDSGVISDISRHISDNEEFPELRKLTRYERAATHSRLFKLLQDECDIEEEEEEEENEDVFDKKEDKFSKLSVRQNKLSQSRSKLSLPLNKCNEGGDEKKINEKLVEELVQSLLRSKKAQVFKNMPKEKLYAAAVTILQEGIDSGETPSEEFSSLLSPLRGGTESSTPAQTPQEFYASDYNEYKQYYDSWSEDAVEIMPSKAFKLLQEHLGANKLGTLEGILAKCPRILSSKNIPREILKLLDESGSDCSPAPSQNVPHSNDVTNT